MRYNFRNNEVRELKTTVYYEGANFVGFPNFFNILQSNKDLGLIYNQLISKEFQSLSEKKEKLNFVADIYERPEYFYDLYKRLCVIVSKKFPDKIAFPDLIIIDELPKEYRDKPWIAMFIDDADASRVDIKAGIYYKHSSLSHPFFDFIVTHELIHWVISHYSKIDYPYSNILEEGVCDFLSYYILLESNLINEKILTNFLIYNRSLENSDTLASSYFRFSKFVLNNVLSSGIESLFETIQKGRSAVNQLKLNLSNEIESSKYIHCIVRAYNNAENILPLPIYSYILLQEIFARNLTDFTVIDLLDIFPTREILECSLQNLIGLNLINNDKEQYCRSIMNFPANIKYDLTHEMVS